MHKDFAGSPVVKTLHSQSRGLGLVPDQGTRSHILQLRAMKIPHATAKNQLSQMKKKKEKKRNAVMCTPTQHNRLVLSP